MAKARFLGTVLLAAALSACGGSSDEPGGDEGGLSKAEYVERGDAICQRLEDRGQSVAVPPQRAPLEAHVSFLDDLLAALRPAHEDFTELAAPDGDESAKERFDGYWERVESELERAREAALAGDRKQYEEAVAGLGEDDSLSEGFQDFGFEVCGST